jgi:hypothetical protein
MRMSTVAANRLQLKRRSARLPLNALVRLAGQDHQKCAFTLLPALATGLNRYGAAIQVGRELLIGSILSVRHGRGGVETRARVVARQAKASSLTALSFLTGMAQKIFGELRSRQLQAEVLLGRWQSSLESRAACGSFHLINGDLSPFVCNSSSY